MKIAESGDMCNGNVGHSYKHFQLVYWLHEDSYVCFKMLLPSLEVEQAYFTEFELPAAARP